MKFVLFAFYQLQNLMFQLPYHRIPHITNAVRQSFQLLNMNS